jgi:hypothetical protein
MATLNTPASGARSDAVATATRHPRRIVATVPDSVYGALIALSLEQGRSLSNLVAYMLEAGTARATAAREAGEHEWRNGR